MKSTLTAFLIATNPIEANSFTISPERLSVFDWATEYSVPTQIFLNVQRLKQSKKPYGFSHWQGKIYENEKGIYLHLFAVFVNCAEIDRILPYRQKLEVSITSMRRYFESGEKVDGISKEEIDEAGFFLKEGILFLNQYLRDPCGNGVFGNPKNQSIKLKLD